jgi:HPt (histidine-containing phosphotransfer) domain-containing protein
MDLGRLFRGESAKLLAEIREAAGRKDKQALQRAAHSLKGSVATFAADDALDAAMKIETFSRGQESAGLEEAISTLEAEVERLLEALAELEASGEPVAGKLS